VDANGCQFTLTGGTANGVGKFTYTATATDLAGNKAATVTGSYTVQYQFSGFLQPVNDTGRPSACPSPCAISVFKAGSTVPAKFQLKDASGNLVQAASLPVWVTPQKGSTTTAVIDETLYADTATTGNTYRWDSTAQQYIYNWGTPKNGGGYYWLIGVKLDDGSTYTVNLALR
jgi:hypothetical protein